MSNATSASGGPGNVTVFGAGGPVTYPVTTMNTVAYLSYDGAGDIFVDGADASSDFQFAELASGKTTFKAIHLNQTIGLPGGIQPYGKYVVVGDKEHRTRYTSSCVGRS